jgi:hypothetical protein
MAQRITGQVRVQQAVQDQNFWDLPNDNERLTALQTLDSDFAQLDATNQVEALNSFRQSFTGGVQQTAQSEQGLDFGVVGDIANRAIQSGSSGLIDRPDTDNFGANLAGDIIGGVAQAGIGASVALGLGALVPLGLGTGALIAGGSALGQGLGQAGTYIRNRLDQGQKVGLEQAPQIGLQALAGTALGAFTPAGSKALLPIGQKAIASAAPMATSALGRFAKDALVQGLGNAGTEAVTQQLDYGKIDPASVALSGAMGVGGAGFSHGVSALSQSIKQAQISGISPRKFLEQQATGLRDKLEQRKQAFTGNQAATGQSPVQLEASAAVQAPSADDLLLIRIQQGGAANANKTLNALRVKLAREVKVTGFKGDTQGQSRAQQRYDVIDSIYKLSKKDPKAALGRVDALINRTKPQTLQPQRPLAGLLPERSSYKAMKRIEAAKSKLANNTIAPSKEPVVVGGKKAFELMALSRREKAAARVGESYEQQQKRKADKAIGVAARLRNEKRKLANQSGGFIEIVPDSVKKVPQAGLPKDRVIEVLPDKKPKLKQMEGRYTVPSAKKIIEGKIQERVEQAKALPNNKLQVEDFRKLEKELGQKVRTTTGAMQEFYARRLDMVQADLEKAKARQKTVSQVRQTVALKDAKPVAVNVKPEPKVADFDVTKELKKAEFVDDVPTREKVKALSEDLRSLTERNGDSSSEAAAHEVLQELGYSVRRSKTKDGVTYNVVFAGKIRKLDPKGTIGSLFSKVSKEGKNPYDLAARKAVDSGREGRVLALGRLNEGEDAKGGVYQQKFQEIVAKQQEQVQERASAGQQIEELRKGQVLLERLDLVTTEKEFTQVFNDAEKLNYDLLPESFSKAFGDKVGRAASVIEPTKGIQFEEKVNAKGETQFRAIEQHSSGYQVDSGKKYSDSKPDKQAAEWYVRADDTKSPIVSGKRTYKEAVKLAERMGLSKELEGKTEYSNYTKNADKMAALDKYIPKEAAAKKAWATVKQVLSDGQMADVKYFAEKYGLTESKALVSRPNELIYDVGINAKTGDVNLKVIDENGQLRTRILAQAVDDVNAIRSEIESIVASDAEPLYSISKRQLTEAELAERGNRGDGTTLEVRDRQGNIIEQRTENLVPVSERITPAAKALAEELKGNIKDKENFTRSLDKVSFDDKLAILESNNKRVKNQISKYLLEEPCP